MANEGESEVCKWLKSLSDETLNLERRAARFHSMGFHSLKSLKYLKATDVDEIFANDTPPLLLAEKRILQQELEALGQKPTVASGKISCTTTSAAGPSSSFGSVTQNQCAPNTSTKQLSSPLDAKQTEMNHNLKFLETQIKSANEHINTLQTRYNSLKPLASFRSRLCSKCHKPGHLKSTCSAPLCSDYRVCNVRDKHPELKADIKALQQELKDLEKKRKTSVDELEKFSLSRKRANTNFFSVMRPRLRATNVLRYVSRANLDTDLLILERALAKKIPEDESQDWQLPLIIEQFKGSHVLSLMNNSTS